MTTVLAHIAIAVVDLEKASVIYSALGFVVGEDEILEREQVKLRKAKKEGICLELIAPYPAGTGNVAKFLAKRGAGLHHIALNSNDLQQDLKRLEALSIASLPGYPAVGSEGSAVAFLDPHSTGGVLIELVQAGE